MPADTLALSKELQVLFFFPYNLGFSTAHLPPPELKALFGKVAERLGRCYPAYRFAAANYPPLTGTILEGGAFLRGVPVSEGSSSQALIERELGTQGLQLLSPVQEEVVYVAHGVGTVLLTLRLRLDDLGELAGLSAKLLPVIDALRGHSDALALSKDWTRFRTAVHEVYAELDTLYDMWGLELRGQPPRGFINCMSQAFILRTTASEPSLSCERAALPELLSQLTGLPAEDNGNILSGSSGVEFCAEGWDGAVAVVSDPERCSWLRFFWTYATCSWATLSDLDAYLYDQMRQMARPRRLVQKDAKQIMQATRRIQNSLALLAHEAIPSNVWDAQEQLAMHQGIFDAWDTESLLSGIEKKVEYLSEQYGNLNDLIADAAQQRMNWVMTTFTFLTFAGVLADCISSIDYEGRNLATPLRLFVIFLGTLGVIAISAGVGFVMHSRRSLDE